FHVYVEERVVELLGDRAQGRKLRDTGIGEDDVEPALLALNLGEQAIEIVKVRHVSLDAGHISPDLLHRRSQLGLTAPRDEDVGAFAHKPLRRGKANATVATSNECNFSFKLPNFFSPYFLFCSLFFALPFSSYPDERSASKYRIGEPPVSARSPL